MESGTTGVETAPAPVSRAATTASPPLDPPRVLGVDLTRLLRRAPLMVARPGWAVAYAAALCVAVVACGAVAAVNTDAADWHPVPLVVLLAVLAAIADRVRIRIHEQTISGAFVPIALAMVLLGPAPAALASASCDCIGTLGLRVAPLDRLANLLSGVVFATCGALLARALLGSVHHEATLTLDAVVVIVFVATTPVNFFIIAGHARIVRGPRIAEMFRRDYLGMWPGIVMAAFVAALLTSAYVRFGLPVIIGVVVALLLFHYVATALVRSQQRANVLRAHEERRADLGLQIRAGERERWARELREDAVSELEHLRRTLSAAVGMGDDVARTITDDVVQTLSALIGGLRHLIDELIPPGLEAFGLEVALRDLQNSARARDGLEMMVEIDDGVNFPLASPTERGIYRIVEEVVRELGTRRAERSRSRFAAPMRACS